MVVALAEGAQVALITVLGLTVVAASGVGGPLLLARYLGKQKAAEQAQAKLDKAEDRKREDERAEEVRKAAAAAVEAAAKVAEQVETDKLERLEAANLVAAQAQQAAELLLTTNSTVAATSAALDAKIDTLQLGQEQIHELANSHYTAQMQLTLAATEALLALMKKSEVAPELIADTETKVAAMRLEIEQRLIATAQAAKE